MTLTDAEITVTRDHIIEPLGVRCRALHTLNETTVIDVSEPVLHTPATWRMAIWIFAVTAVLAACVAVAMGWR